MKRTLLVLSVLAVVTGIGAADPGYLVIRVNLNGPTDVSFRDPAAAPGDSSAQPGQSAGGIPRAGGRMGAGSGARGNNPPPPPAGGGTPPGSGSGFGGGMSSTGGGGGGAKFTTDEGTPAGPAGNAGSLTSEKQANWFVATMDVNMAATKRGNETNYLVNHRWGRTPNLKPDAALVDVYHVQFLKNDPISVEYAKVAAEKRKDEPLKVAEWLLARWNMPGTPRLIDLDVRAKFEELVDELGKEQSKLSPADQAKVAALLAVKEGLKKPLPVPTNELERLKTLPGMGDSYKPMSKGHYVVLHAAAQDKLAERIHLRLEQILAGYYYWFALQGKALPFPTHQLVVILAENSTKFDALHQLFDSLPLMTDGFYAAIDNVAVVSAQRLDDSYRAFKTHVADLEKALKAEGLTLEKLVRGDALNKKQSEIKPEFLQYARAVALANQAAEEEGEVSTLMYEAVQQLASASGLLPRSVLVPQALRTGLGAFFATPRSSSELNLPALWSGVGGQHWVYLPLVRKLLEAEKGTDKKVQWEERGATTARTIEKLNLLRILTDQEFGEADRADKADKSFKKTKAEAEAWAVTYFLAHKKLEQLRRFYDELALMPRDMELPAEVVQQAFARAFDLLADPSKPDLSPAKVEQLEKEFREFMGYQVLPVDTAARK